MTPIQMNAALVFAERRARRLRAERLSDAAFAAQGAAKDIEKQIKALQE